MAIVTCEVSGISFETTPLSADEIAYLDGSYTCKECLNLRQWVKDYYNAPTKYAKKMARRKIIGWIKECGG